MGDVGVFSAGHLDVHDIQVAVEVASAGCFTHVVKDVAVVAGKMCLITTVCNV